MRAAEHVRTGIDTGTYACAHVHDVAMFPQNNSRTRVKVRLIQGHIPKIICKLYRKFHCSSLKNTVT